MLNLPGSSIVPALSSPKQRLHKGHGRAAVFADLMELD